MRNDFCTRAKRFEPLMRQAIFLDPSEFCFESDRHQQQLSTPGRMKKWFYQQFCLLHFSGVWAKSFRRDRLFVVLRWRNTFGTLEMSFFSSSTSSRWKATCRAKRVGKPRFKKTKMRGRLSSYVSKAYANPTRCSWARKVSRRHKLSSEITPVWYIGLRCMCHIPSNHDCFLLPVYFRLHCRLLSVTKRTKSYIGRTNWSQ